MTKINKYEELECWQEARHLTCRVYDMTRKDQFNRDFGLVNQIQRAAVSIMSNIAEGFTRRSNKEYIQFLFIAMSSAAEVQNHLYIALDQKYIEKEMFSEVYSQVGKTSQIISGLIRYLRSQ